MILHELGHIALKHDPSSANSIKKNMEHEADMFAAGALLIEVADETDRILKTAGLIAALCSLVLAHKDLKGGETHPDPDERLNMVLTRLNFHKVEIRPADQLWGFAAWGLMLWRVAHQKKHPMPRRFVDYKTFFLDLVDGMQDVKK